MVLGPCRLSGVAHRCARGIATLSTVCNRTVAPRGAVNARGVTASFCIRSFSMLSQCAAQRNNEVTENRTDQVAQMLRTVNREKSQPSPVYSVLEIDSENKIVERQMTKHQLCDVGLLNGRDLRAWVSQTKFQEQSLLPRTGCVVVCFEHIKCLVLKDRVFLLLNADLTSSQRNQFLGLLDVKGKAAQLQETPFEFAAVEACLIQVMLAYYGQLNILSAAVRMGLDNISNPQRGNAVVVSSQGIKELLPLKFQIASMQTSATEVRNAVRDVLNDDEDLLEMYLTDKAEQIMRPIDDHDDAELLLEGFERQLQEVVNELQSLSQKIKDTEQVVQIGLDNTRNRIMQIELIVSMGTLAIAAGALPAALFGMNLVSGLEQHPQAFSAVCMLGVAAPTVLFGVMWRVCRSKKLL